jgi:hypothetical protein
MEGIVMGGLNMFIKKKLREYRDPERTGIPKGNPIGLSRNKYHGCLLKMTNKHPKVVAEELGVSYSLMRRWMVDDNFKELINELYEELKMEFILSVNNIIIKLDDEKLDEKAILDFFDDAHLLNVELKKQILFTMEIYSTRVTGHRLLLMLRLMKKFLSKEKQDDDVNRKITGMIKHHGSQLLTEFKQAPFKGTIDTAFVDLLLLSALLLEVLEYG